MRAYKSSSRAVARARAAVLLANVNINAEIEARLKEKHMSADEALMLMANQARGDLGDFMDTSTLMIDLRKAKEQGKMSLIKKLKQRTVTKIGKNESDDDVEIHDLEIELHDSQSAIDKILKVHKRYSKDEDSNNSGITKPVSIPADLLAPDLLDVYRDIKTGNNSEYALDGGRGSTKSTFISEVLIMLLLNNPDMHALALRQVKDTIRESIYSQLKWAVGELAQYNDFSYDDFKFITNPLEITYLPTGQKVYFRGADDPMNIKSIKPPFGYIGLLWFEEYDQFRGDAQIRNIVQSALRGGDKAYRFESWNTPRSINHWTNKYLAIPKPGRFHSHTDYLNVPKEWLGKIFLDEAEFIKEANPAVYEHEYLGVANGTGGQVFENLGLREITDDEIGQFDHVITGLDWGYFPDPLSFGKMHYDAARMTLYIFDEYRSKKQGNEESYKSLIEGGHYLPDEQLIADSAEPKSVADYREFGANIRGAEKGPGSVEYSMKWLQRLVKIVIDPVRCPYHAEEFLNYELEQDKNGEFITSYPDKNNHAIDDTRYATNLIWRVRGQ